MFLYLTNSGFVAFSYVEPCTINFDLNLLYCFDKVVRLVCGFGLLLLLVCLIMGGVMFGRFVIIVFS